MPVCLDVWSNSTPSMCTMQPVAISQAKPSLHHAFIQTSMQDTCLFVWLKICPILWDSVIMVVKASLKEGKKIWACHCWFKTDSLSTNLQLQQVRLNFIHRCPSQQLVHIKDKRFQPTGGNVFCWWEVFFSPRTDEAICQERRRVSVWWRKFIFDNWFTRWSFG